MATGAGWQGHPHMILPFLLGSWPLPCQGPSRARRKTEESYLSCEIYLNLTLAFFQKGTFRGQFHSKLCCLCSSTCWLATKHQAAKQSRHTACQAAFQGNAWAAWPQSHARVQSSCIPEQDSVHTYTERRDHCKAVRIWGLTRGIHSLCRRERNDLQNSWGDGQLWQILLPKQMSMNQPSLLCL